MKKEKERKIPMFKTMLVQFGDMKLDLYIFISTHEKTDNLEV